MNKLLLLVFMSLSSCVLAQSSILKFTPADTLQAKYTKGLDAFFAEGYVKNISASAIKIVWKRTYISTPKSCETYVYDMFSDYQPWKSFSPKVLPLNTNDSSIIGLFFNTECCEPGPTTLRMDFYLSDDTTKSLVQVHFTCGVITKIDYLEVPEFSIQPNPAADVLNLKINDNSTEPFTYEIIAATGLLIKAATATGNNTEIELEGIPNGMYFLRVRQGASSSAIQRFIIARAGS